MTTSFNKEQELHEPIRLCDEDGNLNELSIGWSKKQIYDCNLKGRWGRRKKWNYWAVTSEDCLFSITVSSLDYAGLVFLYFYDFHTKEFKEKTYTIPFAKGCHLHPAVCDDVVFNHPKLNVSMLTEGRNTHIIVDAKDFCGVHLTADIIVLYPENYDTLNVVIPWNQKTFQFTSKHEGMSVKGHIHLNDQSYHLEPDSAFACLDFGRGIWPREVCWNWANVSGISNGRRIGVNLGAGWTNGTGMTENALVVDGNLYKLSEDIQFEYDSNDYKKPWKIRSTVTDQVNLVFYPDYERIARSNMILVKSELHQVIGHVSGTIRIPSQSGTELETIEIDNLIGCTEDHFTRW